MNIDDNQNLVEEALEKSESMFRSPRMFDDNANAVTGVITWAPAKSIWFSSMALSAIILGPIYFTWGAFFLFIGSTAVTICLGHSVGMHRLLIHRSYACSLFIERLFVYLGTVVGMAGPTGIIQQHDIRDWAQRQPKCHAFLSHQSGILRDFFWQLHCNIKLEKPPRLTIEKRVSDDRFYQFLDKTMFAQQVPWAVLFFIIGGLPWLVWGIAVRVALSLLGHWLIGYFAHNSGPQNWHISDMNAQGHNVRFCSALTMGESFHNNHHAFPASARLGLYKGEIDLGWLTLCGLQKLGLVWNIKTPSNLPTRNTLTALEPMMKKQPSDKASNLTGILLHITAGSLALVYAWSISKTEYVTTGLQFVMPLGIILATHTLWLALRSKLYSGFAGLALSRTVQTSFVGVSIIMVAAIFAPMPAESADIGDAIDNILAILFCLAIIAAIVFIIGLILVWSYKGVRALFKSNSKKDDNNITLDLGTLGIVFMLLVAGSVEGLPNTYSFTKDGQSESSHYINAPSKQVWQALEVATSPDFALPAWLQVFPQPVAVLIDEGVGYGANRVVKFKGREGQGNLSMRVIKRTENQVTLQVLSDTSPIANWMRHKALTYEVAPSATRTKLTVRLEYDRLLSPAWFFKPLTSFVSFLAMDVLARDTKHRAEKSASASLNQVELR